MAMADEKGHKGSGRWRIPQDVRIALERIYEVDKCPSVAARAVLAAELNVTPRQVQIWFQNKRQRAGARQSKAERKQAASASAKQLPVVTGIALAAHQQVDRTPAQVEICTAQGRPAEPAPTASVAPVSSAGEDAQNQLLLDLQRVAAMQLGMQMIQSMQGMPAMMAPHGMPPDMAAMQAVQQLWAASGLPHGPPHALQLLQALPPTIAAPTIAAPVPPRAPTGGSSAGRCTTSGDAPAASSLVSRDMVGRPDRQSPPLLSSAPLPCPSSVGLAVDSTVGSNARNAVSANLVDLCGLAGTAQGQGMRRNNTTDSLADLAMVATHQLTSSVGTVDTADVDVEKMSRIGSLADLSSLSRFGSLADLGSLIPHATPPHG